MGKSGFWKVCEIMMVEEKDLLLLFVYGRRKEEYGSQRLEEGKGGG